MRMDRRTFLVAGCASIAGCGDESNPPTPPPPPPPPSPIQLTFSFSEGFAGWEAAYSDYFLGQEATIAFAFGHERLPTPLDARSGIYLSSWNGPDDVFMFISRRITGLAPSTRYRIEIGIALATNAPPGCIGPGAPGEDVYVKAGGAGNRPEKIVNTSSYVTVNFDKGVQAEEGSNAIIVGNLAQETPGDCLQPVYQPKQLSTRGRGVTISSNSDGHLWLIVGTDSGFEGFTKFYLLGGTATLTPA